MSVMLHPMGILVFLAGRTPLKVFLCASFLTVYLYGHPFALITDHKPLLSLFDKQASKPVSPQASGRIQHWALTLASYEYTLEFRSSTHHANAWAGCLSPKKLSVPVPAELVLLVKHLDNAPISASQIKTWTLRNPVLARVLRCIREGWPNEVDDELKPYWQKRLELSVLDNCILWGRRILIPKPVQLHILKELHGGHPGVTQMKALARMFVWWLGMDADIERLVQGCDQCHPRQHSIHGSGPQGPGHVCPWTWLAPYKERFSPTGRCSLLVDWSAPHDVYHSQGHD